MIGVHIGLFELSVIGSIIFYKTLIKPAIAVAQLTYENGYSIKNFSPLL